MIGRNHLVVATVYRIERIIQPLEYRFIFSFFQYMHRKHTESSGFALTNFCEIEMAADELKRMADKEYMLFVHVRFVFIPFFHMLQPLKINPFPLTAFTLERTS